MFPQIHLPKDLVSANNSISFSPPKKKTHYDYSYYQESFNLKWLYNCFKSLIDLEIYSQEKIKKKDFKIAKEKNQV